MKISTLSMLNKKVACIKVLFTIIFLLTTTLSFSQITGAWTQSGPGGEWQAQAGSIYVRITSSTNVTINGSETMGCSGAYSDSAVDNNPSLRFLYNVDGTGSLNGSITVGYFTGQLSTTVANVSDPLLHIDRVGGGVGDDTNSGLYAINTGSWTELSENDVHFESTATTFNRRIETLAANSTAECGTSNIGTAAGSLQFNGVYNSFVLSATQLGPNGGDAIEFVFTGIKYAVIANDDTGISVTEGIGGTAVTNVLSNDTLNANTPSIGTGGLVLSQLSTNNVGVNLNTSTGAVYVTPAVLPGTYSVEYQICETANPTNCDTAIATVIVLPDVDGDGVDDITDLDNDNDGILDTDEGKCTTQIQSDTWTISGTTASYDFGNGVIAEVTTTNALNFTSGNFTNQPFWSENLANHPSLQSSFYLG